MSEHQPHHRPHHRTVDRVVELLGAAGTDRRGLTLTRLAATIGAPVSSVQKLAYGMVATGLLTEQDGRYAVGPAPAALARRAGQPAVTSPTTAELVDLHERTGAAALLTVRLGDDAVNLDAVGLSDSAAYADATRWRHPLRATAGGRVLAAHLPETLRVEWATDVTGGGPEDVMGLLDELQTIREHGAARGVGGPLRPDLEAVAVPVRDERGEVVAALSLARPGGAADVPGLDELEQVLRDATRLRPAPRRVAGLPPTAP